MMIILTFDFSNEILVKPFVSKFCEYGILVINTKIYIYDPVVSRLIPDDSVDKNI